MNSFLLRGVAALFLTTAAARALTMTQTSLLNGGGPATGNSAASASTSFVYQNFSPSLGTLTAVIFSSNITIGGTSTEHNPFQFPVPLSPFVAYMGHLDFFSGANVLVGASFNGQENGSSTTLQPNQNHTFSHSFSESFTRTYTAPGDLAFFTGANSGSVLTAAKVSGGNSYGMIIGTVTTNATLTYVYSVPESGSALASLLIGCVAIFVLRHRQRRAIASP